MGVSVFMDIGTWKRLHVQQRPLTLKPYTQKCTGSLFLTTHFSSQQKVVVMNRVDRCDAMDPEAFL